MKTVKTKVEGTGYIWAIPKSDYEIRNELADVDGDASKVVPFTYIIKSHDSDYRDGAVMVHEFDIVAQVPEGVDLIKAAVATMRDEIVKLQSETKKKVDELEKKIRDLALIEYQPES